MKKIINHIWASKFWVLFLLITLAAVNFLASWYHFRLDLTKEKRYTLSNVTKAILKKLQDPVVIDVFLKGDFPSGFKKLEATTKELLEEFKEYGHSKIVFRFMNPADEISPGKTYADTLLAMGAIPINLKVQLKAGEQQQLVFPVAWMRYKNNSTLVPIYTGARRIITPEEMNSAEALMEYQFIHAISKIQKNTRPLIGYVVGNGEPTGPEVQDLIEGVLRPNYSLFSFHLPAQPSIPDTFKALLIVKPAQTFTEEEKFKLDQYVMRGGKILWAVDNLEAEMDSLQLNAQTVAYERNLNLTDLFFRYGARINPDLIMDLQCDYLPFIAGGTQENPQYEFLKWNYFPLFESKNNHPINKNLRLVAGRFVNSIDTVTAEGIRKTVLLSSSANSRTIGTPALISLNENRNAPEDAKFKRKDIPAAVLLEGKFKSLYQGRISVQRADSMAARGTPFVSQNTSENKMIILADGDMLLNDFSIRLQQALPMGVNQFTLGTNYEYQFANREFIINCLEYLLNEEGIMETRNKDFVLRVLDTQKVSAQKLTWQLLNTVVPLLLVIAGGLVYQQVRKRKYTR